MSDEWLYKAANAEAELDIARKKLELLEQFYRDIVELTIKHDNITSKEDVDYAVVKSNKLGEVLSKVNSNWYKR